MNNPSLHHEKACQILNSPENYPGLVHRKLSERKFLMWHYSSFDAYVSWALFCKEEESWVRRIVWDQSLCFPSKDTEPHTYGCEILVSYDKSRELVDSLSTISLRPLQQSQVIGIDGATSGIEVGNHWLSCRLSWWYVPSPDWQPLISWFEETLRYFESVMPNRTDKMR